MATDIKEILALREELKEREPDTILLFRVEDEHGDLYRAYNRDAHEVAEFREDGERWVGDFRLGRNVFSWAGFQISALDAVLARIERAGKRAAVLEPAEGGKPPGGVPVERVAFKGTVDDTGDHPAYAGDYPDPDKIAAIQARRPCPKLCKSCDPAAEHHWAFYSESPIGYGCKHCEARGVECSRCLGVGAIDGEDDETGDTGEVDCPECNGLGIVEVVRIGRREVEAMLEDRAALLAACKLGSATLADYGCDRRAIDALEAAIARVESRA